MRNESPAQKIWRRLKRNKVAFTSLTLIMIIILIAILAPWLAPYSFETQDIDRILESPTRDHLHVQSPEVRNNPGARSVAILASPLAFSHVIAPAA